MVFSRYSMARNPVVLIHGYSDSGESFKVWKDILIRSGYDANSVHVCSYRTLTNEVTIKDLAEGFDRALRIQTGLGEEQDFDAIVHSTGMLVIRSWLTVYSHRSEGKKGRAGRLKRLIGLAPATFGSPLAHKGRSWLGAIFKGNRQLGPDFMEAGDRVLDALELGSSFTWKLAHQDLVNPTQKPFYGENADTPYVFIFCGMQGFDGIAKLANEPGTDGTVRWAGCSLNTRKITIDLTQDPQRPTTSPTAVGDRIKINPWCQNIDIPLIPIPRLNHETILSQPGKDLPNLVLTALGVSSKTDFDQWHLKVRANAAQDQLLIKPGQKEGEAWQQFVIRAVDERGDGIPDFYVQLFTRIEDGQLASLREQEIKIDAHTYSNDSSYRCFHLNLKDLGLDSQRQVQLKNLHLRIMASSGSDYVTYYGYGNERIKKDGQSTWDACLDLSPLLKDAKTKLFYPLTTTLVEVQLNREPIPLEYNSPNTVCWFMGKEPNTTNWLTRK